MKKKIIITVAVLLILIPCCILTYIFLTKDNNKVNNNNNNNEMLPIKGSFANKLPRLDASLATQPLMDAFVEYFGSVEDLEEVKMNYTNTHPGYVKLINGETDLIIVTEPSAEELSLAQEKGVELEVTKIVNEGFVFFVNSKNPVDNISLDDIVKIYSDQITKWNEVGGNNSKIIAYQRPVNSGSQTGMLSLVMKDVPIKDPTTEEAVETMGGIIDIVADYDNNIDGIGYSYYYYANVMYGTPKIKFLSINGVKPTYETIQNETYPLMTAYYIVTRKDANDSVKKFKAALLSEDGASVAKGAGYVPIS